MSAGGGSVRIATSDAEVAACHPVMHELRPHVEAGRFLAAVRGTPLGGTERAQQARQRLERLQGAGAADGANR